jgi:hypothetical protein
MDPFTNFVVSFLCCVVVYAIGIIWIRMHTPKRMDYQPAYLTWLKWNLIGCAWFTWPLFGILLGLLFPDPSGLGFLGGLL